MVLVFNKDLLRFRQKRMREESERKERREREGVFAVNTSFSPADYHRVKKKKSLTRKNTLLRYC